MSINLTVIKSALSVVTILLAMVGGYATYTSARDHFRRPHHFAKPFSFITLEIQNPRDPQNPTRIYLDSPSSVEDIKFEGNKLSYHAAGISHPQSAVPFPGYVVSGEGRIVFGGAILDLNDGQVELNGLDLCRRELIVSRSGESWQGMLRIAH